MFDSLCYLLVSYLSVFCLTTPNFSRLFLAEHLLSASFRESIDALKEAGLTDTEILEIMSESVDGQTITKKSSSIKESGQELPSKNNDITNETPSVRKRKTAALSTEKQRKTVRQGSPGHSIDREDVHFDYSFDRVPLSSLSIGQNTFSFSADMMKRPILLKEL